jgi:hypothetical protein
MISLMAVAGWKTGATDGWAKLGPRGCSGGDTAGKDGDTTGKDGGGGGNWLLVKLAGTAPGEFSPILTTGASSIIGAAGWRSPFLAAGAENGLGGVGLALETAVGT